MAPRPERRRLSRIAASIEVALSTSERENVTGTVSDLCAVGLRMAASSVVPVGTKCRVRLQAGTDRIEAHGTVVRSQGESLALRFDEVAYDDFQLLRSFLLGHADDPAVVADELSDRLGFLEEA